MGGLDGFSGIEVAILAADLRGFRVFRLLCRFPPWDSWEKNDHSSKTLPSLPFWDSLGGFSANPVFFTSISRERNSENGLNTLNPPTPGKKNTNKKEGGRMLYCSLGLKTARLDQIDPVVDHAGDLYYLVDANFLACLWNHLKKKLSGQSDMAIADARMRYDAIRSLATTILPSSIQNALAGHPVLPKAASPHTDPRVRKAIDELEVDYDGPWGLRTYEVLRFDDDVAVFDANHLADLVAWAESRKRLKPAATPVKRRRVSVGDPALFEADSVD